MYRSRAPIKQAQDQLAELKQQDLADAKLSQTVRDLDYLYRSAYFQTKDKQRRGVLLLGIAFFVLCGLFGAEMFVFVPKLKVPRGTGAVPEKERRQLLVFASCGIVVLVVALAVLRIVLVPAETKPAAQLADAQNGTAEQESDTSPPSRPKRSTCLRRLRRKRRSGRSSADPFCRTPMRSPRTGIFRRNGTVRWSFPATVRR